MILSDLPELPLTWILSILAIGLLTLTLAGYDGTVHTMLGALVGAVTMAFAKLQERKEEENS